MSFFIQLILYLVVPIVLLVVDNIVSSYKNSSKPQKRPLIPHDTKSQENIDFEKIFGEIREIEIRNKKKRKAKQEIDPFAVSNQQQEIPKTFLGRLAAGFSSFVNRSISGACLGAGRGAITGLKIGAVVALPADFLWWCKGGFIGESSHDIISMLIIIPIVVLVSITVIGLLFGLVKGFFQGPDVEVN